MRHLVAAVVLAVSSTLAPLAAAAPPSPLRVLVTNDDGVGAPGIDAVVRALSQNPALAITVIAPATNQSGTGDSFTTGPVNVFPSSTAGAFPATAVAGYPADTVFYGVTYAMPVPPDLVVSGINAGQNVGNLTELSGTVGAALVAARFHIPAIAVSTALGAGIDYTEAATYTAQLVERFRTSKSLRSKLSPPKEPTALVVNVNFPTCPTGRTRGVVLASLGEITTITGYTPGTGTLMVPVVQTTSPFVIDCQVPTSGAFANDLEALRAGWATVTPLGANLGGVTRRLKSLRLLEKIPF
ncbi:MAG: survival protein SurE [bacterium]|nr:survival protein SurE [bacterium]